MKKKIEGAFTGTTEQFLEHCANLEPHEDVDDVLLSHDELVQEVMLSEGISKAEAKKIVDAVQMEELNRGLATLMAEGLIEIKSYDETGEPLYGLTPLGVRYSEKHLK